MRVKPSKPAFFSSLLESIAAGEKDVGVTALEQLYEVAIDGNNRPFVEVRQIAAALFNVYVANGDYRKASTLAVRAYVKSDLLAGSLDVTSLIEALAMSANYGGDSDIYRPLVSFIGEAENFALYKKLDRFLRAHSCKRMIDVLALAQHFEKEAFGLLVGEAMSEDVMSLGWRYTEDISDLEVQRIELCTFLVRSEHRMAARYAEEAKAITKRRSIRATLKHVGASKIRVDMGRMKKLYLQDIESLFKRRRLFLQAEVKGRLVQIGTNHLLQAGSIGNISDSEDEELRPDVCPELSQESQNLLEQLLAKCYALYLWDADCSLNFLLSADVRHGFLKNHLRKPFQLHNVVFSKSSQDGDYKTNDFWIKQLEGNVSSEALTKIEAGFKTFSGKIDDLIHHLNSHVMQVKVSPTEMARRSGLGMSDRHCGSDRGYFDYEPFFVNMFRRKEELDASESGEVFTDLCFGGMQSLTALNFELIRDYLRGDVSHSVRRYCEDFMELVKMLVENPYLRTSLLTAIQDARDSAVVEVQEIASWFQIFNENQPGETKLGEMVDVVSTLLRSCHPKALGECAIHFEPAAEGLRVRGDAFSAVFDILYILIQNVAEHAGVQAGLVNCAINVSLREGCAAIEISNRLTDQEVAKEHLDTALKLLRTDNVSPEGEGKTGLRKINRILRNAVGEAAKELALRHEEERFFVTILLPASSTSV